MEAQMAASGRLKKRVRSLRTGGIFFTAGSLPPAERFLGIGESHGIVIQRTAFSPRRGGLP
jgi:hypothetical protein